MLLCMFCSNNRKIFTKFLLYELIKVILKQRRTISITILEK